MGAPSGRLEVGRIGRAHGLRGEVVVTLTTNRLERAEPGAELYAGERQLVVTASRPHQGRWLLCFAGVTDRTGAEALRGQVLTAEPLPADGDEGQLWVHEMVGAEVVDVDGRALGTVASVEANPAHDLLVLGDGGLIPIVFVTEHRRGHPSVIVANIPEGLLDL